MNNNFIDSIYKRFFQRSNTKLLILLFAFVLFHKPIEMIVSGTIVNYALKYVVTTWYNDIIFVMISVLIYLFIIHRFKNYIPSLFSLFYFVLIPVIYCFYRSTKSPWTFTSFCFYSRLKYADIIILISIVTLLLLIKPKKQLKPVVVNSFFDDESLGRQKKDELGYSPYAQLLADKISSGAFNKAFAIGINGKWGSGKTSFIDLIKRKVYEHNDEIIEINFNPWNSSNPDALIRDFFENIQEKIKPYHSSLSTLLVSYSNKLVTLNSNTLSQSIQASATAIFGFESLSSLFNEINNALKKINRKMIVYIDDLDRLDKNEIIEVIRLIRNTANFYNTFFIVAYDRNYITNALKDHNAYNHGQFLEKIFQIEITLPYFNTNIFRHKLAENVKDKFPQHYHQIIHEEVIGTSTSVPVYLNNWLESMRDVTRLSNALLLNLTSLMGEVVFKDFMRLELIRLKFPSVYELLFKRTFEFLEASGKFDNLYYYQLKNIDKSKNKELKDENQNIKTHLELFLVNNNQDISVPKSEIKKIISLLDNIFGNDYSFSNKHRSHLSVIYPSKFNRYFAYGLVEGSLSEVEFSKARSLNQEEFNSQINTWAEKGLISEISDRLELIKSFDNREDFEKIIKAIFHFASLKTNTDNYWNGNIVGYNSKDLLEKLNNYEKNLVNKYYGELGEDRLKEFVRSLFEQAEEPYFFEAVFISYVSSESSKYFPLDEDELDEIVLGYLKKYTIKTDKLNHNVWNLYYSCRRKKYVSAGGNTSEEEIFSKSKEVMQTFILNKDLDEYLFSVINVEPFKQKTFAIINSVVELFDSWVSFKKVIFNQDEGKWKYLNEFKKFFCVFEAKGFSLFVEFEFKDIPINEKFKNN